EAVALVDPIRGFLPRLRDLRDGDGFGAPDDGALLGTQPPPRARARPPGELGADVARDALRGAVLLDAPSEHVADALPARLLDAPGATQRVLREPVHQRRRDGV